MKLYDRKWSPRLTSAFNEVASRGHSHLQRILLPTRLSSHPSVVPLFCFPTRLAAFIRHVSHTHSQQPRQPRLTSSKWLLLLIYSSAYGKVIYITFVFKKYIAGAMEIGDNDGGWPGHVSNFSLEKANQMAAMVCVWLFYIFRSSIRAYHHHSIFPIDFAAAWHSQGAYRNVWRNRGIFRWKWKVERALKIAQFAHIIGMTKRFL